ncbi:MAG: DUF393 domain-containing protein [Proteobacteria bacterium]|nr:DUF393 domain-containing protein [Pseudomonadota bacterium]
MGDEPKTRVYYNSACPVCRAGIESQRGKMTACDIDWIDVHTHPEAAKEAGADLEFVRERLHVIAPDGSRHVGADAFTQLWQDTPGRRWMAALARLPGLRRLNRFLYNRFARRLYLWNRRKGHW